jgi:hypothetical protein
MSPRRIKKAGSSGVSIKHVIIVAYVLIFGAVMLYGAFTWRYAPIKHVNGQYVDKRGAAHSAEDYRRFILWERSVFVMGFGGIAVGLVGGVLGKFLKSRGEGASKSGGGI